MCCDRTDSGSLFHSECEGIAKPRLPMAFLGGTEERDSQFPQVGLLVLIKDNKYVGWENLMALKVFRLYLNKMRYVMEPV